MEQSELSKLQGNNRKLVAVWGTSLIGAFLGGYALHGSSTGFTIMNMILVIIGFVTVTKWWWKLTKKLLMELREHKNAQTS